MVLDVKAKNGPEVITENYHGGNNQLWEYKNGMIYSKLNGWVQHKICNCGKVPSWVTYSVSSLSWVQNGLAPLWSLLQQDALTWHALSLIFLSHSLRPVITTTIEPQQIKFAVSKVRYIFLQNLCYQIFGSNKYFSCLELCGEESYVLLSTHENGIDIDSV